MHNRYTILHFLALFEIYALHNIFIVINILLQYALFYRCMYVWQINYIMH